jgi:hypothetical protein
VFWHWREKLGRIFLQTIRYPSDEKIPRLDVFDVVEELPDPKFEIPFDADPFQRKAVFTGNLDDLTEFEGEMWNQPWRKE